MLMPAAGLYTGGTSKLSSSGCHVIIPMHAPGSCTAPTLCLCWQLKREFEEEEAACKAAIAGPAVVQRGKPQPPAMFPPAGQPLDLAIWFACCNGAVTLRAWESHAKPQATCRCMPWPFEIDQCEAYGGACYAQLPVSAEGQLGLLLNQLGDCAYLCNCRPCPGQLQTAVADPTDSVCSTCRAPAHVQPTTQAGGAIPDQAKICQGGPAGSHQQVLPWPRISMSIACRLSQVTICTA